LKIHIHFSVRLFRSGARGEGYCMDTYQSQQPTNACEVVARQLCLASVHGAVGVLHSARKLRTYGIAADALFEQIRNVADALFDLLSRRLCDSWHLRRWRAWPPRLAWLRAFVSSSCGATVP